MGIQYLSVVESRYFLTASVRAKMTTSGFRSPLVHCPIYQNRTRVLCFWLDGSVKKRMTPEQIWRDHMGISTVKYLWVTQCVMLWWIKGLLTACAFPNWQAVTIKGYIKTWIQTHTSYTYKASLLKNSFLFICNFAVDFHAEYHITKFYLQITGYFFAVE